MSRNTEQDILRPYLAEVCSLLAVFLLSVSRERSEHDDAAARKRLVGALPPDCRTALRARVAPASSQPTTQATHHRSLRQGPVRPPPFLSATGTTSQRGNRHKRRPGCLRPGSCYPFQSPRT